MNSHRISTSLCVLSLAGILFFPGPASAVNLSVGSGDASLSVDVDAYGSFGEDVFGAGTGDAIYDPVGALAAGGTTFESGVAIGIGVTPGSRTFLSTGDFDTSDDVPGRLADPGFSGTTATTASSAFSFGGLDFDLDQAVTGNASGATLTQTYRVTNNGTVSIDFDLVRYLDGDLQFDSSIDDGGGKLNSGEDTILFETDAGGAADLDTTFVGITSKGGTIPGTNRFEIEAFSDLVELGGTIPSGSALDDTVTGDGGDADMFIDAGSEYDVTLALRNVFSLNPGGSVTYTTETLFGTNPQTVSGVPEPSAFALGIISLLGLCTWRRPTRS